MFAIEGKSVYIIDENGKSQKNKAPQEGTPTTSSSTGFLSASRLRTTADELASLGLQLAPCRGPGHHRQAKKIKIVKIDHAALRAAIYSLIGLIKSTVRADARGENG